MKSLREVEAKRKILAEHEPVPDPTYGQICRVCWSVGRVNGPLTGDPWPCRTIRVAVAVHDQHPDYDLAWRPE